MIPAILQNKREIQHILVTGQSNSVGAYGTPLLSTSQPYSNKKFTGGTRPGGGGSNLASLVDLIEDIAGGGTYGETIASGMANTLTFRNPAKQFLVSNHGADGTPYSGIKKGQSPYTNGQAQVVAGKARVQALRRRYRVGAVCVIHGESDAIANLGATYQANMTEFQADYNLDCKTISGQVQTVLLIQAQLQPFQQTGVPHAQLAAAVANPTGILIACPRYFLPYVDDLHHNAAAYRWLGEYFAKAYEAAIFQGLTWRPVSPATVSRSGAVVTIDFHVPVAPLVFDTTLVTDPGNKGFSYTDDSSSASVSSVAITGPTQVQVTLNTTPTGANKRMRYAYASGSSGGSAGPRGNLRDSDNRTSLYGNSLYNWCLHFNEAVA